MNIGDCSRFLVLAVALASWPALAQELGKAGDKAGLGEGDAFEGKPYPACLDASQYGHAAFMSRYQAVPLSELLEENHRRHEPVVAAVMDRIATRAYKIRTVPASDAPRIAAVYRDTLYLACVERMQQLHKPK
ncbi:MAG TPA: hypothetical protein VIT90_00125 [Lysobacter sp.]